MSDFCVFFPCKSSSQTPLASVPSAFAELERLLHNLLRADDVQSKVVAGAAVLVSTSFGHSPRFYAKPDGSGWIVVKGTIIDVASERAAVDLEQLLDQIIAQEPGDLNRYEGTFCVAAWDAHKGQGWAFNDQPSGLNLYYGEYGGGLYVSTTGLALARALGLGLDPHGVLEFMQKSVLLTPSTLFAGLRRMDVGEHVRYRAGKLVQDRHWYACPPKVGSPKARVRDADQAAETIAALAVDRLSRYGAIAEPVISDLTGGLDTRLLSSAANAAGLDLTVTVNGPPDAEDVLIAHELAATMGWEMKHFDTSSFWTSEVTPDLRRELVYRTSGELRFSEVYHHFLSRPLLGKEFSLHMIGTGGDFYRTFPWEESFKMPYQSLATLTPPDDLFTFDSLSCLYANLKPRIAASSCRRHGAALTQQWDATFVWKMTSHISLYLSAVHNWLPSVSPMMGAGILDVALSMPWKMRLGGQLQRQVIACLSPQAAAFESFHSARRERRGTAQPGLKSAAAELRRYAGRFAAAVERRVFKGLFRKREPDKPPVSLEATAPLPYLTPEFRAFLDPETMRSRGLYAVDGLKRALSGNDNEWRAKSGLIVRLAQIEQLCHELDLQPETNFWAPVLNGHH
jgi:hypothetical protein